MITTETNYDNLNTGVKWSTIPPLTKHLGFCYMSSHETSSIGTKSNFVILQTNTAISACDCETVDNSDLQKWHLNSGFNI